MCVGRFCHHGSGMASRFIPTNACPLGGGPWDTRAIDARAVTEYVRAQRVKILLFVFFAVVLAILMVFVPSLLTGRWYATLWKECAPRYATALRRTDTLAVDLVVPGDAARGGRTVLFCGDLRRGGYGH